MASSKRMPPSMVMLDPNGTFADDPSGLFDDEPSNISMFDGPSMIFGVPQIESDDSLEEAIAKETNRTKSNKYKKFMEEKRSNRVEAKYLPVLQPMYVSKSGHYRHQRDDSLGADRYNPTAPSPKPKQYGQDRYGGTGNEAADACRYGVGNGMKSASKKREQFVPFRKFDKNKERKKSDHKQQQTTNDKKTNGFLSRFSGNSPRHSSHSSEEVNKTYNIKNQSGKSNKYSMTLSQHRRSSPIEEDEDSERRSHSSHARLLRDTPSGTSTQYFSAKSNSGHLSRTFVQTNEHSKRSKKSIVTSSLDAGASPDEILAFGAVVDHLTRGGSIMNAKNVYQKEVQLLDKDRMDHTKKSNRKKTDGAKLPPCFQKYENESNDETDYETDYETRYETDYDGISRQQTNGEDSLPPFKGDKYAATGIRHNEDSIIGESVASQSNFESEFLATTFGSEDDDSFLSDLDSEYLSGSADESATYQSYSTISSNSSRSDKSSRQKAKTKKSKKKSLFNILKGKKHNDSVENTLVHVDRTPDAFEDENDENENATNKPRNQMKKIGEAIFSKKQIPKNSDNPTSCTNNDENLAQANRSNNLVGLSSDLFHQNQEKDSKEDKLRHVISVFVNDDSGKTTENSQSKPAMEPLSHVENEETSSFHVLSDNSYVSDYNENDDGDDGGDDDMCGGSIISLEETIVSLVEGFENIAQFTTDSMRSARSLFFDEDHNGLELTAADDFEKQMEELDETSEIPENLQPIPMLSPDPPPPEPAPEKVCELETEDSGQGLESTKEPRFTSTKAIAKRFQVADTPSSKNDTKSCKNETASSKKQKSLRKRMPFLKSKKASTEIKSKKASTGKKSKIHVKLDDDFDYEDNDGDFDDEESEYVVDIKVYNREESGEPVSAKTFLDPKPLFDDEERQRKDKKDNKDRTKKKRRKKTLKNTQIISSVPMSVGDICCAAVPIGNKLLLSSQEHLEFAAKELKEMMVRHSDCDKHTRKGQVVPSFDKTSAAVGFKFNKKRDTSNKSDSERQIMQSFDDTIAAIASATTESKTLGQGPPEMEAPGTPKEKLSNQRARVANEHGNKIGKESRKPMRKSKSFRRTKGSF